MEPLKTIADNPLVFDALKEKLLSKFVIEKIDTIFLDLPNQLLGERVRARVDGRHLVEEALNEIAALKTVNNKREALHPGR